MCRSILWSGLTDRQRMSCQWRKKGTEQHPPAPDRTRRQTQISKLWIFWFSLCWKISTLTYRKEMVKSTQCVFSTVPQLQTEEKYFSTFSQFRWPIHHRCLNTLKTDDPIHLQSPNHKANLPCWCEAGMYLLFHSACWENWRRPVVQPEQSSQPRSCHRWRSCSELCPQLNVGASLEIPTSLETRVHNHSFI